MGEGPIAGIEHVAVAVRDAAAALRRYQLLGFEPVRVEEIPGGIRSHVVRSGDAYVEILEATAEDSDLSSFLERRGEGLHHLCLRVTSLQAAIDVAETAGCALVSEEAIVDARGTRVFVHPGSNGGVLTGLVEVHEQGSGGAAD